MKNGKGGGRACGLRIGACTRGAWRRTPWNRTDAVLEEVLVVFFVIREVEEAAVGTGMEIGSAAGAGGGGEESKNVVVWVRWIHEKERGQK